MESLSDPHCLAAANQRMHRKEKVSGTVSPWGRGQGARLVKTERGLRSEPNNALQCHALQRSLRSRFRQQLKAGVRCLFMRAALYMRQV